MKPPSRGPLVAALILGAAVPSAARAAAPPVKIACIGASTTSGDGSSAGHHYPDELQRLLGAGYTVTNFGVSGTTMLKAPAASYWKTAALTQALAAEPQIAIFWFGGNDAKPENWTAHKGEFLGDYEAMVRQFQALPSHPRTFAILSLVTRDTEGIPKAVVDGEVIPLVRQAADETGSGVVDVHGALADHPEYFPDGIHPNDQGTVAVAKLVQAALVAPPPADAGTGADAARESSPEGALQPPPDAPADAPAEAAPEAPAEPALETPPEATADSGTPGASDGPAAVTPGADAGPTPPAADGCGCAVRSRTGSRSSAALLLLALALRRARRRR